MKISAPFRFAGCAAGLAIVLAGCNSGGSTSSLPTGPAASTRAAARARFQPHRLWAVPEIARIPRVLFLTDWGLKTVTAYSMPTMRVLGSVGGFESPMGACNDRSGNVWVTDYDTGTLTRFDRALQITGELNDTYGSPLACAVDPTTGNLAVANSNIGGNVVIYRHARGSGKAISNPDQSEYYFIGYDRSGNLWVDGYENSGLKFILSSCSASSCRTIRIRGGAIVTPGFLQWAVGRSSWYIADDSCGGTHETLAYCIYPLSSNGKLGKPITLEDVQGRAVCSAQEGAITDSHSRVLAGSVRAVVIGSSCQYIATITDRWNFPAGGKATNEADGSADGFGVAISAK